MWETYNDQELGAEPDIVSVAPSLRVAKWAIPRRPAYSFRAFTQDWDVYCTHNLSVIFAIYDQYEGLLTRTLALRDFGAIELSHVTIDGRLTEDVCL